MVSGRAKHIVLIVWIAIAIVTMAGVYLHLVDLDADPPLYFSGLGQSLSTDPHHYSYFARNKILFNQWELFDTAKWRMFEITLVSGLSYLAFTLFGVSRISANSVGLILSLLPILIFLLALRRFVNLNGILLALLLLLFNKVLFIYGRLPYTENGVIFWASLLFFVFVYYRQYIWGRIALGLLIALACLTGKIFGFLLVVPVVLSLWHERGQSRRSNILTVLVSCAAFSALWVILVYGGQLRLLLDYYQSQTTGIYGFPDAFKSPITFIERLISFGNDTLFYFHAPALGIAAFIALVFVSFSATKERLLENIPIFFLVVWFAAGQLFFMPENYRPLRYIYVLYFPLAGLVGFIFSAKISTGGRISLKHNYLQHILKFLLFWVLLEQLAFNILYVGQFEEVYRMVVWYSALIAIIVTLVDLKYGFLRFLNWKYFKTFAVIAIVIFCLCSFGLSYSEWQKQKSFNIREAGLDLGEILNKDAVVCGPIAPTLLLENSLKGAIYAVGVTDSDADFFHKYPITHFALDAEAVGLIVRKYPELTDAKTVAEYWIRDSKIVVVRISDLTGNKQAAAYNPTDFEIGLRFMKDKIHDSALCYMEQFIREYPNNKSALKSLGTLYPINGQIDKGMSALQKAVALYPRDFSVFMALAVYYQTRYVASGDSQFKYLARKTYLKAIEINPYQADEAMAMAQKIGGQGF